jgi:glutaminyl-peptide cyclotransferase
MKQYLILLPIIFLAACNGGEKDSDGIIDKDLMPKPTPKISYNIVNVYPHSTKSYTQGLQLYNGKLYEGTGDYTNSLLQIVDVKTGKIEKQHKIGKNTTDSTFGEGINIFKGKLYQLTWVSNIVYVYDVNNIDKPINTFKWPYEGWGITNNGTELIISDGSANLYFADPETFKVKNTIAVTEDGRSIDSINELEYIDGFVFANVYGSDFIIKIDPSSGHVVGKMDFPGIIEKYTPGYTPKPNDEVLNGIAYDSTTKKLFITGKRWPKLFEITLN